MWLVQATREHTSQKDEQPMAKQKCFDEVQKARSQQGDPSKREGQTGQNEAVGASHYEALTMPSIADMRRLLLSTTGRNCLQ